MTAGVPESTRVSVQTISVELLEGKPVRFDNVVSVELVSPWRLVIRLRDGRRIVVEPDFYGEIELCRFEDGGFFDCIEENLKLRIYEDGSSQGG